MAEELQEVSGEMRAKLTFDDVVVKKIVSGAIAEVNGILGLSGNMFTDLAERFRDSSDVIKGINVEVGTKQTAIDVSVICEYDVNISTVFDQAVEKVKENIKFMTELDLVEFNMTVDDVMTREQFLEKYRGKENGETK